MPEKSWRLRPCLGYDWIAGVAGPRAQGRGWRPQLASAPACAPSGRCCSFSDCFTPLGEHLQYRVSCLGPWHSDRHRDGAHRVFVE